nr:putative reverse transcriptase domain-containing protein [Tanacetum cinerariifolium]
MLILRKNLKKTLRRILRKNLKKNLRRILRKNQKKKSQKRLNRWIRRMLKMRSLRRPYYVENIRLRRELKDVEIRYTLMRMDKEWAEKELHRLRALPYGLYEEAFELESLITMPPRRVKRTNSPRRSRRTAVERLISTRVAKAIAEHERNRPNPANVGGAVNVQGYTHNTFMNAKPHPFNGTESVLGLRSWIEKVEQVFEICKCAETDKVKFVACTFEGCALTWWNENELWTLTLKGDDIEAYNNHFHKLALMCLDLVTPEKKKIKRYIRGLLERVSATGTTYTTMVNALRRVRGVKKWVIRRKIVESDFWVQVITPCRMWPALVVVRKDTSETSVLKRRISKMRELVRELMLCGLRIYSRILTWSRADEKKLEDILIVRDFPKVFPDDLSGLPSVREIEFRIDLISGAFPVVKSLYRLAPSKMVELLNQLKELQEKGFIRPRHSPWGAPVFDYECEIEYHPGKANVVADALSRKERLKPRRVRVMSMTIHFGPKTKILEAQKEPAKDLKALVESL